MYAHICIKITQAIHIFILIQKYSSKIMLILLVVGIVLSRIGFNYNELHHRPNGPSKETNFFRSNCAQLLISCPIEMTRNYLFFSILSLIWGIIHTFSLDAIIEWHLAFRYVNRCRRRLCRRCVDIFAFLHNHFYRNTEKNLFHFSSSDVIPSNDGNHTHSVCAFIFENDPIYRSESKNLSNDTF